MGPAEEEAVAAGRLVVPRGAVLLLEDIGERPYRLDRAVTTLIAGCTSWDAGDNAGDQDMYGAGFALAAGTTLTIGDAAAETLTVAGATVNFNGGVNSGATFANDLTVNAAATLFGDRVGAVAGGALGTLMTDAAGLTTISTDTINGVMTGPGAGVPATRRRSTTGTGRW